MIVCWWSCLDVDDHPDNVISWFINQQFPDQIPVVFFWGPRGAPQWAAGQYAIGAQGRVWQDHWGQQQGEAVDQKTGDH